MSSKIVLLFTTSVILASLAVMTIPQASALINRDYTTTMDDHVTARFTGHMKVCGDHLCLPSERTNWEKAVWDHQRTASQDTFSNPQQHGEDAMHKMAGSTDAPTTTNHGSQKPTMKSTMPTISPPTSANMTENVQKGSK